MKIKYLEGSPKEYRYNAVTGVFYDWDSNEEEKLIGPEFSFRPLACRVFEGRCFGRQNDQLWTEFYFLDDENNISIILFNGRSAINFVEQSRDHRLSVSSIGSFSLTATSKREGDHFTSHFKFQKLSTRGSEDLLAVAKSFDLYSTAVNRSSKITQLLAQSSFYNQIPTHSMFPEEEVATGLTQSQVKKIVEGYTKDLAPRSELAGLVAVKDVESIKNGIKLSLEEGMQQRYSALEASFQSQMRNIRPHVIQVPGRVDVQLNERLHHCFEEALTLLSVEKQIYLAGVAGAGKTTLSEQCAKAMNLSFGHISCSLGMSEAQLLGRMNAHGEYIPSQFIEIYENGGVFLFDEIDAADPNTMLVINSALANGKISVPSRTGKNTAARHKDCYIITAANTWGFGSTEYIGRNQLDAAFLDRFVASKIQVDYDKQLEKEISSSYPYLAILMWEIRQNCADHKLKRLVSTRSIVSGIRLIHAGYTLSDFLFKRFFVGWSEAEIEKALTRKNKEKLKPELAPAFQPQNSGGDGQSQEGEGNGEGKSGNSDSGSQDQQNQNQSQQDSSGNSNQQNGNNSNKQQNNGDSNETSNGKPQSGQNGKGNQNGNSQSGNPGKSQNQGAGSTASDVDNFDFYGTKKKEEPAQPSSGGKGGSQASEIVLKSIVEKLRK